MSLQKKLEEANRKFMTGLIEALRNRSLTELLEEITPPVVRPSVKKHPRPKKPKAVVPPPVVPEPTPPPVPEVEPVKEVSVKQDDLGRFFAEVNGQTVIHTRKQVVLQRIKKAGFTAVVEPTKLSPIVVFLPGDSTLAPSTIFVSRTTDGKFTANVLGNTYTCARERDLRRRVQKLQASAWVSPPAATEIREQP